jgi:8-oxo-dGTP pyrophosphatase MutT (NUDIX family)
MSEARAERLRAALLDPLEAQRMKVEGSVAAAVLVPLFERDEELHVVFTRRPAHLRLHAGQVSFPGGRREPSDADLVATALREAHEEVGLDPEAVELVGALAPTPTIVSDIAVYPLVGLIEAPAVPWVLAAEEVDEVLEAPLSRLAATHRLREVERSNGSRITTDTYLAGEDIVWGATARILTDLLVRLGSLVV